MSQLGLSLHSITPAAPTLLDDGAWFMPGAARADVDATLAAVAAVLRAAPPTTMTTPSGGSMSVTTTSCGALGWVSDRAGYRYARCAPDGRAWPAMPDALHALAKRLAAAAGYRGFSPDACLINRYTAGAHMGLHQDRNERDYDAPVVSISLGVPATFLWGGDTRTAPVRKLRLEHGDVVVWGGASRLHFHGVAPVRAAHHPQVGDVRINLTFRTAG